MTNWDFPTPFLDRAITKVCEVHSAGPQIADVCMWNASDFYEHIWNDQTLDYEGAHRTTFIRLWSTMPKFRLLLEINEDICGTSIPIPTPAITLFWVPTMIPTIGTGPIETATIHM